MLFFSRIVNPSVSLRTSSSNPLHPPFPRQLDSLPEPRSASPHDLTLTYEFGVEFAAVKGEEDVKVNACKKGSCQLYNLPKGFDLG